VKRSLISLADALRALCDLAPGDDEARDAILRMLGFGDQSVTHVARTIGAWQPSSTESMAAAAQATSGAVTWAAATRPSERLPAVAQIREIGTELVQTRSGSGAFVRPDWFEKPGDVLEPGDVPAPEAPAPLFGRLWRRGILGAALSTSVQEGDLDLDRILDAMCRRRPLDRLPLLSVATLRRGAQVLLDRAPGMTPFFLDQETLVRALDDILSDDRLEVAYFADCPGRGTGAGTRDDWTAWRPPAAGVPVLIVSDFGIGGPAAAEDRADPSEWLDFIRPAHASGHPLVGLVPCEARRWPPLIARAMTLIHWSERTTVGEVRHAMRDASRAGR